MIEAVGDEYYEAFFAQCHKLLKPHGLVAIQMITCPDSRFELLKQNVDFIQKHIFPGSLLPSVGRINQAVNRTSDFFLHSLEDMGNSYARTLGEWHVAFNQQLEAVRALGFDHFDLDDGGIRPENARNAPAGHRLERHERHRRTTEPAITQRHWCGHRTSLDSQS